MMDLRSRIVVSARGRARAKRRSLAIHADGGRPSAAKAIFDTESRHNPLKELKTGKRIEED